MYQQGNILVRKCPNKETHQKQNKQNKNKKRLVAMGFQRCQPHRVTPGQQ